MKKLLLLSLSVIIVLNLFSQSNNVVIYSEKGEKFTMYVNGVKQNQTPKTNVKGENITSENFQVRVAFEDASIPDVTQNFWTENKNVEITAVITQNRRGNYVIRYRGESPISTASTTSSSTEEYAEFESPQSTTTPTGSSQTQQETVSMQTGTSGESVGFNIDIDDTQNGNQSGVSMQVGVGEDSFNMDINVGDDGLSIRTGLDGARVNTEASAMSQQSHSSVTASSQQTQTSYSGFMPNGSMCNSPSMDQRKYLDFRYAIEEENMFSRQRFIISTMRDNCMMAVQVAGILKQEYPTVTELEVAKQAYRYTYDTENYGVVIDALKSNRDKKELLTFLSAGSTDISIDFTHQETTTEEHQEVIEYEAEPSHYQMAGYSGRIGCPWPMSSNDFENAKKSISNRSFEDSKLTLARQITSNNCLTCDQIVEIMNLFSFEDSKLEFAKFAYDYVYDISNYYKINDAFTFEMTIEELDEYLQGK